MRRLDVIFNDAVFILAKSRCKENITSGLKFNFWRFKNSQEQVVTDFYNRYQNAILIIANDNLMEFVAFGRVSGRSKSCETFKDLIKLQPGERVQWIRDEHDPMKPEFHTSERVVPIDWIST